MQFSSPFYVLLDAFLQLVQIGSALHEAVAGCWFGEFGEPDAFVTLFEVA